MDTICERMGLKPELAAALLLNLELEGYLSRLPGGSSSADALTGGGVIKSIVVQNHCVEALSDSLLSNSGLRCSSSVPIICRSLFCALAA